MIRYANEKGLRYRIQDIIGELLNSKSYVLYPKEPEVLS